MQSHKFESRSGLTLSNWESQKTRESCDRSIDKAKQKIERFELYQSPKRASTKSVSPDRQSHRQEMTKSVSQYIDQSPSLGIDDRRTEKLIKSQPQYQSIEMFGGVSKLPVTTSFISPDRDRDPELLPTRIFSSFKTSCVSVPGLSTLPSDVINDFRTELLRQDGPPAMGNESFPIYTAKLMNQARNISDTQGEDSRIFLTFNEKGAVKKYDLKNNNYTKILEFNPYGVKSKADGSRACIICAQISKDNSRLYTGTEDGHLLEWDIREGNLVKNHGKLHNFEIDLLKLTQANKYL